MGCSSSLDRSHKKKFEDHFRLGKLLGTGSFGEVYECTYIRTGTMYAVKIMTRVSRQSGQWAHENMFEREIRFMRYIESSSVIKLVDFFQDSKHLHIVMELCHGGQLFDQICQKKQFSEEEAARVCHQILTILAYLHDRNIAHRDIKAENFLYKDFEACSELKLIDFGMSVQLPSKISFLSDICGSPLYFAPELIKKKYDLKVDMWACGIILYFMLFGCYPYNGSTIEKIMEEITNKPVTYPEEIILSDDGFDFLQNLLKKDPNERFTAEEALQHRWLSNNLWKKHIDNADDLTLSNMLTDASLESKTYSNNSE